MTEPDKADELLSKADTLLGRYRPSATAPATNESVRLLPAGASAGPMTDFPLLTEVIELHATPPEAHAQALPAAFSNAVANAVTNNVSGKSAVDETRLREEILAALAPELEQRLSDTLKPRATELLDWTMQTVQLELSLSIRAAVRSAVAEAVDKALERHRRGTNADNP